MHSRRPPSDVSGVTLIEALIALAVLVIITALAAPNFTNLLSSSKSKATAQDLQADLDLARSEAVRLASNVTVCAANAAQTACTTTSTSNWAVGWIVLDGTTVRKVNTAVPSSLTLTGPTSVVFTSIGMSTVTASGTVTQFSAFPAGSTVASGFGVCRSGGSSAGSGSGSWAAKKGGC